MSVLTNKNRIGNFTSSQMYRLMGAPKPRKTYIEECNFERKLGRSLGNESNARPTTWGKLLEERCFELLGLEYQLISQETIVHNDFDSWSGSPDGIKKDAVIDIKCPFTLKSFCQLVAIDSVESLKDEYPEYYWQLVSNAILTDMNKAELIVYCPYQSELNDIRIMCDVKPANELYNHYWIANSNDSELPYLIEGKDYQNLNIFEFDILDSEKELLTNAIKEYSTQLI